MPDREEPEVKVVDRRWWAQQNDPAAAGAEPPGADWQPGKPTYVEELERQLAEKDRQLQETLTKYRDAAREFDDVRARLRKDIARDIERGRRAILVEMLDVVDNLDRALDAARDAEGSASLASGVDMVRRLFLTKLEGFGVRRLQPMGEPFDPTRHEAVTMVPTTESAQDGIVCGVLAPGYLMGDEMLRPAMVAVGKLEART